jgi:polysaccharide export outer membrane protein
MKIKIRPAFLRLMILFFLAGILTSCVPRERIVYFQGNLDAVSEVEQYSAKIQPDDLLEINVYGRNMEATRIFNQESNLGGSQTYLVDEEGNIEFPVLGKVKVGGLTRMEAIQYLKGMLSREIVDPGVSLLIKNFRITVLGEVSSPGTYPLENEKITILEALGMAGDLTINGVRENVLVVREEGGERNYYRVDLTKSEVFNSPVYYLAQNDVVYVEPNQNKINTSSNTIRNVSFGISLASFLITIVTLITR